MVSHHDQRVVGFLEISLGLTRVRIPVHEAKGDLDEIATFATDATGAGIILVRDGASEKEVEHAMTQAAREAAKHFARKLLN